MTEKEVVKEEVETKTDAPKEEPKKEVKKEEPKDSTKFFRSRLNGLTVVLGGHKSTDPTDLETVVFATKVEMFQGDAVKFGYLATDDKRAHKILEGDYNVEEITEKEYNTAMEVK